MGKIINKVEVEAYRQSTWSS